VFTVISRWKDILRHLVGVPIMMSAYKRLLVRARVIQVLSVPTAQNQSIMISLNMIILANFKLTNYLTINLQLSNNRINVNLDISNAKSVENFIIKINVDANKLICFEMNLKFII